jgi:plasmid stability protein
MEEPRMTDVLIRNVPDDVVSAIEAKAKRLGLSRTEYLRRQMLRVALTSDEPVSVESLRQFAQTFSDLGDPEVMRGAWE